MQRSDVEAVLLLAAPPKRVRSTSAGPANKSTTSATRVHNRIIIVILLFANLRMKSRASHTNVPRTERQVVIEMNSENFVQFPDTNNSNIFRIFVGLSAHTFWSLRDAYRKPTRCRSQNYTPPAQLPTGLIGTIWCIGISNSNNLDS